MRERDIDKLSKAVRRAIAEKETDATTTNHAERDRELYALELKHFINDSARLDRLIEDIAEFIERAATVKTVNETDAILDELVARRFPKEAAE